MKEVKKRLKEEHLWSLNVLRAEGQYIKDVIGLEGFTFFHVIHPPSFGKLTFGKQHGAVIIIYLLSF